jgi:hypothetical protein
LDKSGLSLPPKNQEQSDLPANLTIEKFEAGKAEAYGALCRIFCSKKTGEEILPVYLARFYLALKVGLQIPKDKISGEVMSSILINSAELFRCDLDGVNVLIPSVIAALELVLPEREIKLRFELCLNLPTHLLILPLFCMQVGNSFKNRAAESINSAAAVTFVPSSSLSGTSI